jgi:dipeptidyl aminopeptidase/acylaminoacyl peptidase
MRTPIRLAVVCLALAGVAPLAGAEAPTAPTRPRLYSIEQFLATTSVLDPSFSPDEKEILVSSDQSGIFNAYRLPVAGGEPVPVTRSTTDSTFAVGFFKHDGRVLYKRDQGGNENDHLYVLAADGKERDLTPGDKVKATFSGWSRSGAAFYVQLNDRDPRFFDVHRFDANTLDKRLLFQNDLGYDVGDISDDEKWVALVEPKTTSDSNIYLYDLAKKEAKLLTPHEGWVNNVVAQFSPDSRWLYYLTDAGSEFTYVRRYEMATGKHEDVEKADWDIVYTLFSHDGRYRVTGVNADGRTEIRIRDEVKGAPVPLPALPEGEIRSVKFSDSETKMAFIFNGDRSPNDLYVYDFATGKNARLTRSLSKEIDPDDLVEASVVRFDSFDGMKIPNIFYRPIQATPEHKAPALVWVHGGPGDQTRRGYGALVQYLVNHGYVVLGINNRGSSGYGKTFFTADDRKHGREPLWDCVAGKKYLASLPYVDASRIGIIGGSYGGYMVLAALAFQPDEFKVGVDIFGVSNWIRTLESIPPYWESYRQALYVEIGDPVKDRAMLEATSPLMHAGEIKKPLMVLQGANDPRVIKPESDDIVAAVKKNGVNVEYVVFADEGHGFTKKANRISGYGAVLKFLDANLRGETAPPAATKPAPGGR